MGSLSIGTAGWGFPKEARDAFPGPGSRLEQYARVFSCVEINSTFYRTHRTTTYERWAASVPATFRFSLKVPQTITHANRLNEPGPLLEAFVRETAALGPKRAVLLVQLPPSLAFDERSVRRFFEALRQSYGGLVACEPRHVSWFEAGAGELLRSYRIARVAADPARTAVAAEPGAFGALAYYRWHGTPRTYYSTYDAERVATFARALDPGAADVWCIFDNTALGGATTNALQLADLMRLSTPGVSTTRRPGNSHDR